MINPCQHRWKTGGSGDEGESPMINPCQHRWKTGGSGDEGE